MKANHKLLLFVLLCFASVLLIHYTRRRDETNTERQVEGWGLSSIRDANHYTNTNPRIIPKNLCKHAPFLVVMVHSKPSNTAARNSIRRTWGEQSNTSTTITVVFLLGETSNPHLQQGLEKESEEFGDIIQEEFTDSYNNLTLKSVMTLKLATSHCQQSKYLLKADDDTLVNLGNVEQMLTREGNPDLLVGHLFCEAVPDRNPSSKWFAPYYLYPESKYPNYLSGGGYLMSMEVANELYRVIKETPLYHMEDVYVTGICAKKAGVTPLHSGLFSKRRALPPCRLKEMVAVYNVGVDMEEFYSVIKDGFWSGECAKAEAFSSVKWILGNVFVVGDNPFSYRKFCN